MQLLTKVKTRWCGGWSEVGEGEGEEGFDGGEDVDFVAAGEEHFDIVSGKFFIFEESLTACSAGWYGLFHFLSVGATGGYALK